MSLINLNLKFGKKFAITETMMINSVCQGGFGPLISVVNNSEPEQVVEALDYFPFLI